MVILVTGSTGHLGRGLVLMLREANYVVRGLDKNPNPSTTDFVGSITDKEFCRSAVKGCSFILHTASLHKPHVVTHSRQDFVDVNITGTLNLLEAAVEENVQCFVYTSTTSTFGSALSATKNDDCDVEEAVWIDENVTPVPKNIYGITKCMAEDLCQLFWKLHKLPTIVLKVSRFFPEKDDNAKVRNFATLDNVKLNELLYRRADIYDMCTAHICAMKKGTELGHERFIISSDSCFTKDDLKHLMVRNGPHELLSRYYPRFEQIYAEAGYKMFPVVDRVYRNDKAKQMLDWKPEYTFERGLESLSLNRDIVSDLAKRVRHNGYHDQTLAQTFLGEDPYPVQNFVEGG